MEFKGGANYIHLYNIIYNYFFLFAAQRSMDDLLSYDTATDRDRDDCISPPFSYSTGSSRASVSTFSKTS